MAWDIGSGEYGTVGLPARTEFTSCVSDAGGANDFYADLP